MIGLESCFAAVNTILKEEKKYSLLNLIKLLTVNPRKIFGFETDLLKDGVDAELVIIDPAEKWKFTEDSIYSRSSNSPFTGETFTGKVSATLVLNQVSEL